MVFFQNLINALQWGSFYALIALGYSMVYGILMLFNFAHGDVFMVGSYIGLGVSSALLALAGLVAFGSALADETLPLRSVNQANAVIDAALEAHGGAEALAADVVTLTTARTLLNNGAPANVSTDGGVFLNEAEVVSADQDDADETYGDGAGDDYDEARSRVRRQERGALVFGHRAAEDVSVDQIGQRLGRDEQRSTGECFGMRQIGAVGVHYPHVRLTGLERSVGNLGSIRRPA